MLNQQLVRHIATSLRRWREAANISASMKTSCCYDIDNSMVLMTPSLAWSTSHVVENCY